MSPAVAISIASVIVIKNDIISMFFMISDRSPVQTAKWRAKLKEPPIKMIAQIIS